MVQKNILFFKLEVILVLIILCACSDLNAKSQTTLFQISSILWSLKLLLFSDHTALQLSSSVLTFAAETKDKILLYGKYRHFSALFCQLTKSTSQNQ